MKKSKLLFLIVIFSFTAIKGFAQVTSVPQEAKDNFARQYPDAVDTDWKNDVIKVTVSFDLDGKMMVAEYNNKGIWKSTEQEFTLDELSDAVKEGFDKSKYADREVLEVVKVYYPGDEIRYRLKVEKNTLQKKYLYFSEKGRLLREVNTL